MGKKSIEIAGAGVDGTIAMLKKAYGGELLSVFITFGISRKT